MANFFYNSFINYFILSFFFLYNSSFFAVDLGINNSSSTIKMVGNRITGFGNNNITSVVEVNRNSLTFARVHENVDDNLDIMGQFTISESGHYCLPNDLKSISGIVISIEVDDVVLDLNGYKISGIPGAVVATDVGVKVKAGASNIIIKNGLIEHKGVGVSVERPSTCVFIEDLDIKFSNTGISFGELGSDFIQDCQISHCNISTCTSVGIVLNRCENLVVDYCVTNTNGLGVSLKNCNCVELHKCSSNFNSTSGYIASGCVGCQYIDCSACRNGGDLGGFFSSTGYNNIYKQCISEDNAGVVSGIGFNLDGGETSSCIFNCLAKGNGTKSGVLVSPSGIGILLSGAVRCTINENNLIDNKGTGTNSLGILETSGAIVNVIYKNFAFGPGIFTAGPMTKNYVGSIANVVTVVGPGFAFGAHFPASNLDVVA